MFKRLFCWAYFRGSLFSEGLIIGGSFAFQIGLDLTIKTASTNSPWAYIREGLLLEEYLRLSFGGLRCFCIFGRASLFLFVFFGGGGGLGGGGEFYGILRTGIVRLHHACSKDFQGLLRTHPRLLSQVASDGLEGGEGGRKRK